jgi:hypothetical protein
MVGIVRANLIILPYNLNLFNELEVREISASIVTLYAGLIFVSEEEGDEYGFSYLSMILIAYLNVRFFVLWVYAVSYTQKNRFKIARKILKYLQCWIHSREINEQITLVSDWNDVRRTGMKYSKATESKHKHSMIDTKHK